ncbi:MAG: bleomycin resistance protein [Ginsengibacter sp.]
MDALVVDFKKNGVTIVDTIQTVDFGKFLHILDPEGNKIELWEPKD